MNKIEKGSIWWTIRTNAEAESYDGARECSPWQVKAHRHETYSSYGRSWVLSAFNVDTGEVDDDSNCSVYAKDGDVGRTLFAGEADAWSAYLSGSWGLVEAFLRAVADLRDGRDRIREIVREREGDVRAVLVRHLDEVGRLLARIDAGGLLGKGDR